MEKTIQFKDFVNVLAFSTLFLVPIVLFKSPFEGYVFYFPMLLCLPLFFLAQKVYSINKTYFFIVLLYLASNAFNIVQGNNTVPLFLKTFIGVMFAYTFFYYLIKFNNFELEKLFSYYIIGCKIVVAIGIIQYITFQIGFRPGYDYSWLFNKWKVVNDQGIIRVNSIIQEPSHLVRLLSPAFFVAVHGLIFKNKYISWQWSIAVILIFFLARSSTGYIGIAIALVLLTLNFAKLKYILMVAIALPVATVLLYTYESGFRIRAASMLYVFKEDKLQASRIDLSTFTLYNHLIVSTEVFRRNPIFGGGLGSHPRSFEKYSLVRNTDLKMSELNKVDASSIFLRTMSEGGLVGLSMIFIFMAKFFIRRKPDDPRWILSNAMLVLFLLCLFRAGHYFLYGLPLFVWMYYYNHTIPKEQYDNTQHT